MWSIKVNLICKNNCFQSEVQQISFFKEKCTIVVLNVIQTHKLNINASFMFSEIKYRSEAYRSNKTSASRFNNYLDEGGCVCRCVSVNTMAQKVLNEFC